MITDDVFGVNLIIAYAKAIPLTTQEQTRRAFLKLLVSYWLSCWQFDTGWDFAASQAQTLGLLRELH